MDYQGANDIQDTNSMIHVHNPNFWILGNNSFDGHANQYNDSENLNICGDSLGAKDRI
jgi:hypothetical protein